MGVEGLALRDHRVVTQLLLAEELAERGQDGAAVAGRGQRTMGRGRALRGVQTLGQHIVSRHTCNK